MPSRCYLKKACYKNNQIIFVLRSLWSKMHVIARYRAAKRYATPTTVRRWHTVQPSKECDRQTDRRTYRSIALMLPAVGRGIIISKNTKLCSCRGTARRATSVEILSIGAIRNVLSLVRCDLLSSTCPPNFKFLCKPIMKIRKKTQNVEIGVVW